MPSNGCEQIRAEQTKECEEEKYHNSLCDDSKSFTSSSSSAASLGLGRPLTAIRIYSVAGDIKLKWPTAVKETLTGERWRWRRRRIGRGSKSRDAKCRLWNIPHFIQITIIIISSRGHLSPFLYSFSPVKSNPIPSHPSTVCLSCDSDNTANWGPTRWWVRLSLMYRPIVVVGNNWQPAIQSASTTPTDDLQLIGL